MKNLKYVLFGLFIYILALSNVEAASMVCEYNANLFTASGDSGNDYIKFRVSYSVDGSRYGSIITEVNTNNSYKEIKTGNQDFADLYITKDGKEVIWGQVSIEHNFTAETMQNYYNNGKGSCPNIKLTAFDETYTSYKAEPVNNGTTSGNNAKVTSGKTTMYDENGEGTEVNDELKITDSCSPIHIDNGTFTNAPGITMKLYMKENGKKYMNMYLTLRGDESEEAKEEFLIEGDTIITLYADDNYQNPYRIQVYQDAIAGLYKQSAVEVQHNEFTCPSNVYIYPQGTLADRIYKITVDKKEAEGFGGEEFEEGTGNEGVSINPDLNFGNANCDTLLGRIDDKTAPAYYLNFAFKLIKYIAIILFFALTVVDFAKATASSKDDAIKKATQSAIKRLIIAIIIFFLPYLINFILDLLGVVSTDPTCGIGA